jgi:hypothetical protein
MVGKNHAHDKNNKKIKFKKVKAVETWKYNEL